MRRINWKAVMKEIKTHMAEKGLTVSLLADEFYGDLSEDAIRKWLNGKRNPNLDHMVSLAEIFGVSLDDLIVLA